MGFSQSPAGTCLEKLGNAFQNITRTHDVLRDQLGLAVIPDTPWDELAASFEKRHPITHNLGIVDRKYLERAQGPDREGREVGISAAEVVSTLDQVLVAVTAVHGCLFQAVPSKKSGELLLTQPRTE